MKGLQRGMNRSASIYTESVRWLRRRKITFAPAFPQRPRGIAGKLILAAAVLATGFFAVNRMTAAAPFASSDAFIQENCAICHSSATPAARLDLTKLGYEPANPD